VQKRIQKWCVREGDERGPLIAVMLTKEVAHLLAAAPQMLAVLIEALDWSVHCRKTGPRVPVAGGWAHRRCISEQEQLRQAPRPGATR